MAIARQLSAALKALLVLTVLLGVLYPATILAVGLVVPGQANGSLIEVDGKVVGSSLLGQAAEGPQWFQARPSASRPHRRHQRRVQPRPAARRTSPLR